LLSRLSDEALEVVERSGLLLRHRSGELARAARAGGDAGHACKDCRYRTSDHFLRDVAVKTQSRRDLRDHVRGQELHDDRD
jgi:hypothetical protein